MIITPSTYAQTWESNLTASARDGTTITASATIHTKGSWSVLIAATTREAYGIVVGIHGVQASATATSQLVDIGFGPASSERVIIPNLDAGAAPTDTPPKQWIIPIYIPSGARLVARNQALIASDTALVVAMLIERPLYEYHAIRCTDYGTNLSLSQGTSVTPGNAVFGSWTQLTASTARDHFLWTIGTDQLADTTLTNLRLLVELGHGPTSTSVRSIGVWQAGTDSSERVYGLLPAVPIYHPVPSSSGIWARAAASTTPEARGVIAYGID